MVQLLGSSSRAQGGSLAPIKEQDEFIAKKESIKRATFPHPPRRAYSSSDYQLLHASASPLPQFQRLAVTPAPAATNSAQSYFDYHPPSPNDDPASPTDGDSPSSTSTSTPPPVLSAQLSINPLRPMLPPPRRSYSVMDYEPVPYTQLPGERLTLQGLPSELHFAIFDWLDPIDSTCLGLTSRHFYDIHRRMHGTVPLSARRQGPNDMEWAWRLAGPLIAAGATKESALAMLLPRGQVYCRKCGISRCELHKHIREWIGEGYEYCEVRQKFGPAAPSGARSVCYRSSPRHPHRCGRHTRQQRAIRLS